MIVQAFSPRGPARDGVIEVDAEQVACRAGDRVRLNFDDERTEVVRVLAIAKVPPATAMVKIGPDDA